MRGHSSIALILLAVTQVWATDPSSDLPLKIGQSTGFSTGVTRNVFRLFEMRHPPQTMAQMTSKDFQAAFQKFLLANDLKKLSTARSPASTVSEKAMHTFEQRLSALKTKLPRKKTLGAKLKMVNDFRAFVTQELRAQAQIAHPDSTDNRLALTLIGYDDDLGSYLDAASESGSSSDEERFSEDHCASDRLALLSSYTVPGTRETRETREPANLPLHTEDSLQILDLLCDR